MPEPAPADVTAFLFKEYESARELTFEIDELRNKFSSFYGTFVTISFAGLALFLNKDATKPVLEQLGAALPLVMLALGLIGGMVIYALARLRSAQLEHFRIINNIREHFLHGHDELRAVVELSAATLPAPSRASGSYMWVCMVIFLSAGLIAASAYAALELSDVFQAWFARVVALGVFTGIALAEDAIYLTHAEPPQR